MITVPPTVGVTILRKRERRAENRNWIRDEATTSVASRGRPPSFAADVHTAMNAPDVPM
jgi:hypothetical protein